MGAVFLVMKTEYVVVVEQAHPLGQLPSLFNPKHYNIEFIEHASQMDRLLGAPILY